MTGATVLVAAPRDDITALAVVERLRRLGADPVVVDTLTFPTTTQLEWSIDEHRSRCELVVGKALPLGAHRCHRGVAETSGSVLRSDEIRSVWMRRPRDVSVPECIAEPEIRGYVQRTNRELLEALFGIVPVHNEPGAERRASRRPIQLATAAAVGLATPRTLITANVANARRFIDATREAGRDVIYKQVAEGVSSGPPTRVVRDADLDRLEDVELCHAMFQQRVTGGVDLRVAVVGDHVFAAEWRTADGELDGVDVRLDSRVRMWPTLLDDDLATKLRRLTASLGLTLGVHDLKVDSERGPVFLEVNPVGQWLDLELEAGHPVSEAVARVLWSGVDARVDQACAPLSIEPLTIDEVSDLQRSAEPAFAH